jgi:hypothetical protein
LRRRGGWEAVGKLRCQLLRAPLPGPPPQSGRPGRCLHKGEPISRGIVRRKMSYSVRQSRVTNNMSRRDIMPREPSPPAARATCAVQLDRCQLSGGQPAAARRRRNHRLLAGAVRRGQAAAAPVLVDGGGRQQQQRTAREVGRVCGSNQAVRCLQKQRRRRLGAHVSVGGGVQRLAAPVGGQHACVGVGGCWGAWGVVGWTANGSRVETPGSSSSHPACHQPQDRRESSRKSNVTANRGSSAGCKAVKRGAGRPPAAPNMTLVSQFMGRFTPAARARVQAGPPPPPLMAAAARWAPTREEEQAVSRATAAVHRAVQYRGGWEGLTKCWSVQTRPWGSIRACLVPA